MTTGELPSNTDFTWSMTIFCLWTTSIFIMLPH
jgi:hypothetical protein